MKAVVMLVISLRVINFKIWSHLGYSGENAIICSPCVAAKASFRVSHEEI